MLLPPSAFYCLPGFRHPLVRPRSSYETVAASICSEGKATLVLPDTSLRVARPGSGCHRRLHTKNPFGEKGRRSKAETGIDNSYAATLRALRANLPKLSEGVRCAGCGDVEMPRLRVAALRGAVRLD